jgi:hypothetical protein
MNVATTGRKEVMDAITVFRKDIYYPLLTSPNQLFNSFWMPAPIKGPIHLPPLQLAAN